MLYFTNIQIRYILCFLFYTEDIKRYSIDFSELILRWLWIEKLVWCIKSKPFIVCTCCCLLWFLPNFVALTWIQSFIYICLKGCFYCSFAFEKKKKSNSKSVTTIIFADIVVKHCSYVIDPSSSDIHFLPLARPIYFFDEKRKTIKKYRVS